MRNPARVGAWLDGIRENVVSSGVPCGVGVKPDTTEGQPWLILSVVSAIAEGDVELFDVEQNAVVLARSVGTSARQAEACYWKADGIIAHSDGPFEGGIIVYLSRESLTTPIRDDTTFPGRSVYYVDATYRVWAAPTTTDD